MSKLDEIRYAVRNVIDANWSRHKRVIVGACAAVVTVGALGFGIWAMDSLTPLTLPKTADEAVAVMNSPKFDKLDRERRVQYAAAATRLLRDVPEEERRELFSDDDARSAMRQAMREQMDDVALRVAMGEPLEDAMQGMMPFGRRPGGPPRDGARDDAQRPEPTPEQREQREQRRAQAAQRMAARFANALQTGNPQRMALRVELFQRIRQARENPPD